MTLNYLCQFAFLSLGELGSLVLLLSLDVLHVLNLIVVLDDSLLSDPFQEYHSVASEEDYDLRPEKHTPDLAFYG